MARSSIFAVFILITSSNFSGRSIGKTAERPVAALPDTLAHVVADGVAEHAVERFGFRDAHRLPITTTSSPSYWTSSVASLGMKMGSFRGHQGIARTISHVGLRRELRLLAPAMSHLGHGLPVVDAGGVEGGRNHRHEQLRAAQGSSGRGACVGVERAACDLGDRITLDNPVGASAFRLKATPLHGRCSLRKAPASRLKTSGRSK